MDADVGGADAEQNREEEVEVELVLEGDEGCDHDRAGEWQEEEAESVGHGDSEWGEMLALYPVGKGKQELSGQVDDGSDLADSIKEEATVATVMRGKDAKKASLPRRVSKRAVRKTAKI